MTARFAYSTVAQRIVFGAGELQGLGAHLDHLGARRALLLTSGSYVRNGVAERARAALGARLAAVFAAVQPHVPDATVAAAAALAARCGADVVIALGGGSAVGTAKAVAAARREPAGASAPLAVAAVPTTYAGSEMTPIYGVTSSAGGRKVTTTDPRVTPALVLYDPDLTLDVPAELSAATGINALAHCVEGVYSTTRSPVTTATALAGIAAIYRALPRCVADGRDREARSEMLAGAYLAGTTIANARIALHHGLCHVLGGTAGVPHGVANSVMLPHAMRFNLPVCAPELAAVARAMGLSVAGLCEQDATAAAVERVAALIEQLGLPRRLRDAGVAADELPRLAAIALTSAAVQANPRAVTEASQLEAVLRAAW